MKIRTNVRAGEKCLGCGGNHNEKISDDSIKVIEQKNIGKKLRLKKDTIRKMKEADLKGIAGGARYSCSNDCTDSCNCNHNEKLAVDKKAKSLTVKTGIKAGVGYLLEPGKIECPN